MKICFLARPSFDKYSVAIFKELREKYDSKIEGIFITSNQDETKYIADTLTKIEICETSSYLQKHWNEFSIENLVEYEKKYDCSPIWKYIYADRFLVKRDYNYAVKVCCGLFTFFEKIFTESKVDFYYSEVIATLQCYVAYIVGKKHGVKYIAQMCSRGILDTEYHYFVREEFQYNSRFNNDYKSIQFNESELYYAKRLLQDFREKTVNVDEKLLASNAPKIDKEFWLAPFKYMFRRFDKNFNNPYSYMYYEGYKDCLNPIRYYVNYNKIKHYYSNVEYNRKYVYFPLHYEPEASTLVCAEKYEKQLFFIDSWAKSLPADTVLYVKEHYFLLGHRDPNFYYQLNKYPNVFLISPWESSRLLIEKAEAVTTLSGTAGFEAMLLGKPVFIGGNSVYENAPGIIKIDDIYDNYINNISSWNKPSEEEIIQYLCECIRSYSPGNAYAGFFPELIESNIDKIVKSLYSEMMNILKV